MFCSPPQLDCRECATECLRELLEGNFLVSISQNGGAKTAACPTRSAGSSLAAAMTIRARLELPSRTLSLALSPLVPLPRTPHKAVSCSYIHPLASKGMVAGSLTY